MVSQDIATSYKNIVAMLLVFVDLGEIVSPRLIFSRGEQAPWAEIPNSAMRPDDQTHLVDLGGIEPPSVQCECTVLPLDHRPNS